jgi:hypothetical protein
MVLLDGQGLLLGLPTTICLILILIHERRHLWVLMATYERAPVSIGPLEHR